MHLSGPTRNELLYGSSVAPPEQTPLRAGPLSLVFEEGDLRRVCMGRQEILRRVYAAVRDKNWATVTPTLSNLKVDRSADSFHVAYDMASRGGEIDFSWNGTIDGSSDGTIVFTMDGQARSTFLRSRIGFCLLHPAECAGSRCLIEHDDGTMSDVVFPEYIVHDQPVPHFASIRAMTQEIASGVKARIELEGDLFEMEDQRNWTDASFKTFCTPLHLPIPVEVPAGTRIRQRITLRLLRDMSGLPPPKGAFIARAPTVEAIRVMPADRPAGPLLAIGLGLSSLAAETSMQQRERLRALHAAHLRVDLRVATDFWQVDLERAIIESTSLGVPLEIALLLPDAPLSTLREVRTKLDALHPTVVRWLVLPDLEQLGRKPHHADLLKAAREALADYSPAVPFAAGTNSDFIFANRYPPPQDDAHAVTFSINPQVHAFDNASMMEALGAQAMVIVSSQRLAGGKPVSVSPVTLLPRINPYAAAPLPWSPPPADPRQRSLFAAAWTLGSVKHLAESGAASVTYFETIGPGGVLDGAAVFPLFHVLADIGEFGGGLVQPTVASDLMKVAGLMVRRAERCRLLLANLTCERQRAAVENVSGAVETRVLDETNVLDAMHSPEAYRAAKGEQTESEGELSITLLPYAVARIDWKDGQFPLP